MSLELLKLVISKVPLINLQPPLTLKLPWLHKNGNKVSMHDTISKEKTHAVHQYCARWIYESNIAFNAIDNDSFKLFSEALGQFGPGWVPPSQYQLREPLLNEEQQRTKEKLKSLEEEWDKEGCSLMTDAWTDMKKRSLMNLCDMEFEPDIYQDIPIFNDSQQPTL